MSFNSDFLSRFEGALHVLIQLIMTWINRRHCRPVHQLEVSTGIAPVLQEPNCSAPFFPQITVSTAESLSADRPESRTQVIMVVLLLNCMYHLTNSKKVGIVQTWKNSECKSEERYSNDLNNLPKTD